MARHYTQVCTYALHKQGSQKRDEVSVKTVRTVTGRDDKSADMTDAVCRCNSRNVLKPRTVRDTSKTNIEPQPKQSNKHLQKWSPQDIDAISSDGRVSSQTNRQGSKERKTYKGGSKLVTLPRIVTPYRDRVDGTRDRVTYQKLVTRSRYGLVRCAVDIWPSHQRDDAVTAGASVDVQRHAARPHLHRP